MYFESMSHDGYTCRDGGLRANNPIQIAVNEARTLWHDNPSFDALVSVRCGYSTKAAPKPSTVALAADDWLASLFSTLIATMNGQDEWDKFTKTLQASDPLLLTRADRLTVRFLKDQEPALDDVEAIPSMEYLVMQENFHYSGSQSEYAPVQPSPGGHISTDLLEVLAVRLMASLYFFEMSSLVVQDDVSIIKGWICCRLRPSEEPFKKLLNQTSQFLVKGGQKYDAFSRDMNVRFKMEISFQLQASDTKPMRIDVKFRDKTYFATISGFPMSLKVCNFIIGDLSPPLKTLNTDDG